MPARKKRVPKPAPRPSGSSQVRTIVEASGAVGATKVFVRLEDWTEFEYGGVSLVLEYEDVRTAFEDESQSGCETTLVLYNPKALRALVNALAALEANPAAARILRHARPLEDE